MKGAAASPLCKALARSLHPTALTTEALDYILAQAGRKYPQSPKLGDGLLAGEKKLIFK